MEETRPPALFYSGFECTSTAALPSGESVARKVSVLPVVYVPTKCILGIHTHYSSFNLH